MTFNYSGIAQTALKQIQDKGRTLTLVSKVAGTYEPQDDTLTGNTETQSSIKGVVTSFNQSDIDGTIIQQDDKQILIAASGVTKPETGDQIIDGSTRFTVVNTEEIKPGDTAVLYKVQVRK